MDRDEALNLLSGRRRGDMEWYRSKGVSDRLGRSSTSGRTWFVPSRNVFLRGKTLCFTRRP